MNGMILNILFYWYCVLVTASQGGKVYVTGDWRLPLSDEDYGDRVEARWVIAGTDGRSSCYAWVKADEGYHFAGFLDENGDEVLAAEGRTEELRLWVTTESAQTEDGIVSGNVLYPAEPQKFTAVFFPDNVDGVTSLKQASEAVQDDALYDLSGRKLTTLRGGQIVIQNRKKLLLTQ